MIVIKVLWFILGYFACGVGYYLLLIYMEVNGITDKYGAFSVTDGIDAAINLVLWPISAIGLGISYLFMKAGKLHERIYEKMEDIRDKRFENSLEKAGFKKERRD